jgi:predicted ATPase
VIDWSWNLLDEPERRALRRLALFNDGFTLEAADAVLGDGALDAVQGLVDQSLLSIRDAAGGLRYRMLETVREFGRLQLEQAGEGDEARAARRAWATAYAGRRAVACSAATSSRRSTRSPPRRSTSPTNCARRWPTATAARSSSCSPCSGPSGRSAASTRA